MASMLHRFISHKRRHWNDAALHTSELQGDWRTKSDMSPLTQVPPEPLVLINSCVMIAANLAVCATISIFRLAHVARLSPLYSNAYKSLLS